MDVWALIHEFWYEGYQQPIGIFSSIEEAKAALLLKEPNLHKEYPNKVVTDDAVVYLGNQRDWNIIKYTMDVFV